MNSGLFTAATVSADGQLKSAAQATKAKAAVVSALTRIDSAFQEGEIDVLLGFEENNPERLTPHELLTILSGG